MVEKSNVLMLWQQEMGFDCMYPNIPFDVLESTSD
jgi:hypothetical protein